MSFHKVITGDCLEVLRTLNAGSIDACITDPPYSSGGMYRSDRGKAIVDKYADGRATNDLDFTGDCMDGHAWQLFTRLWMREVYAALRPAGYVMVFTDWRQLPGLTDAMQASGFTWRGIIPWDKGATARLVHLAYFRHQCEYIVWGTRGPLPADNTPGKKALPGVVHGSSLIRDREHPTEKPADMIAQLMACVDEGSVVLDPFCGSGTTLVAAKQTGRSAIGIEIDEGYANIARRRIADAACLFHQDAPKDDPLLIA